MTNPSPISRIISRVEITFSPDIWMGIPPEYFSKEISKHSSDFDDLDINIDGEFVTLSNLQSLIFSRLLSIERAVGDGPYNLESRSSDKDGYSNNTQLSKFSHPAHARAWNLNKVNEHQ
ncbi:hypothetical protein TNCV_3677771 [Trichonephila clavipes]|nr:hypothetical protein TNCV_3677771 [Trichonephila clavipes]